MIDLKKVQKEIWDNKIAKGFNTADVNFEFNLIHGELAEAFEAYLKKKDNLGEEVADVIIYVLSLASMLNIDIEEEILKKIEKNKKREYKKINGVVTRTKEA